MLACENKAQCLLDELWRKGTDFCITIAPVIVLLMLLICVVGEQVEKERIKCKKQMDEMNNELATAKRELTQSKKAEQLLVEQQNQMSIELVAEKREREKATMEMRR